MNNKPPYSAYNILHVAFYAQEKICKKNADILRVLKNYLPEQPMGYKKILHKSITSSNAF